MTSVLGIDTGVKGGALALLGSDGSLEVYDMPTFEVTVGNKNRHRLDPYGLDDLISKLKARISVAYLEEATSMPLQGVVSVFNYGGAYWALQQVLVCHKIKMEIISPRIWKKALSLRKGKDASLLRASEIFPDHRNLWMKLSKRSTKETGNHNRAEAALIAHYGMDKMGAKIETKPVRRRRLKQEG